MDKLSLIDIGQLWDRVGLKISEQVKTAESNLSLKLDFDGDSDNYYTLTIKENDSTFLTLNGLNTVYASLDDSNKLTLKLRKLTISATLILDGDE